MKDRIQFAFGAEFIEVRAHKLTREIGVSRIVGAFAAGRIVNPLTARSQLMGGMIGGVSSALFESTEIDGEAARYVNTDLAEYQPPANADAVFHATGVRLRELPIRLEPLLPPRSNRSSKTQERISLSAGLVDVFCDVVDGRAAGARPSWAPRCAWPCTTALTGNRSIVSARRDEPRKGKISGGSPATVSGIGA